MGSDILAGTKAERIVSKTKEILNRGNKWRNPFGDGKAGERIIKILISRLPSKVFKVEVACIDKELYPNKAPKIVISMSFIRRFSIMLTGNEVCIEGKGKVTTC